MSPSEDPERVQEFLDRVQAGSTWEPLARAVEKVRREEKAHLEHGRLWFDRMAGGSSESRGRLEDAVARIWPDALGLFEPVSGEEDLVSRRFVARRSEDLRARWLARLGPDFERHHLTLPSGDTRATTALGGRRGEHTEHWLRMWDDMTSVYRLEAAATW